ncbi:TetR/AcrR family transcriptional regulator [Micromonospora humida]|uniref:TetR/AcrR family transcriptional regulator n=1 Tax=Micromonospora humida TaxID=2809018 RepID=A0ABS2IL28_9ACTN|nr:TetR/AcrR family transcriptional regulator [Micromonospora humida]MBM7075047.1 TetR/AcrR family transcriptional regulator [Micromonospora humida]
MRADAARNRTAVLAAADRLFDAATDPDQISMDDIAAAAGVGKGTLFRRFGDRMGLLRALYAQRGDRLRAVLTAAAPAGPPAERALHLLREVVRFKRDSRVLTLALENAGDGSPYRTGSYEEWHVLLVALVTEARGPASADYLAHALLAAVRSDLVEHLRDWPDERWEAGLAALTRAVLDGDASPAAAGADGPTRH